MQQRVLVHASAVIDGAGLRAAPGAVLLDGRTIVAAGAPETIGAPADAVVRTLPDTVVMPGLVNAHCHLDLTRIGPLPFAGDFATWADTVRSRRPQDDDAVADAVAEGVRLARAGGTALLGDIAGAGSRVPIATQRRHGLPGVSFLEVFGLGVRQAEAVAMLRRVTNEVESESRGVRFGVQPHAPYSCGPAVFAGVASLGLPIATHLAETLEEIEFVRDATGPLADLVRRVGAWDDTIHGHGVHPVDLVTDALGGVPCLAAHLNYVDERHLEMLARAGTTVVYCPRSSAYFGHPRDGQPGHRYRAMRAAGITVTLGTDSILGLETSERISVLDEMRLLHRRDGTRAADLVQMATTAGAAALGFEPGPVTLRPGDSAGLIAVPFDATDGGDPVDASMCSDTTPGWVLEPVAGRWP